MSEKGELPPDQVSLPPNYAPSEAYTESPPPAYSTKKSSVVAVTRMVCLTLLAGAFMIGFFSLTHSWLQARRECNCQCDELDNMKSASFVEFPPAPQVASLVAHKEEETPENTIMTDINNNVDQIKDALDEQDMLLKSDVELPPIIDEEIASLQEEVNILDKVEEELEDERQLLEESEKQEMEDLKKKIKIPLDIILGNPALAGKDVNCEVDRQQKEIGGIMTQAIIVKCQDKDNGPPKTLGMPLLSSPSGKSPLGPPLSLLAPIMKMLSAKAKQRANEMNSKNMNGPMPMDGLKKAIMSSIGGPFAGPIRIIRGPMSGPISGPRPFPMPSARFLPIRGPVMSGPRSPIPEIRGNMMSGPRSPIPEIRGPIMSGPRSPIPEIRGPIMSGPRSPIPEIRGPIMSGPRSPFPEFKSIPMPSFNEERKVSNEGRQPKMISMPFNIMKNDEGRQPKMISMPINPMRVANGRSIRVLPFLKEARSNSFTSDIPSFPRIPSGFPLKDIQEFRNLPEPQPRGLNSPIALPGLRLLPGRFINAFPKPTPAVSLTESAEIPKPITHMEMRQPEHKPEGPIVKPNFKPEGPEFGPPKIHTVIGPPRNLPPFKSIHPPMTLPEGHPLPPHIFNPHKPTFAPAPIHPTFAPAPLHPEFTSPHTPIRQEPSPPAPPQSHPHPKINPEGLTGIVTEINSDAEVIHPMGDHASTAPTPRKHHLLVLN